MMHLLDTDLLPACGTDTPDDDGFYHMTPVARDVDCKDCMEWVHA